MRPKIFTNKFDVKTNYVNLYKNEDINCRINKDGASLEEENQLLIFGKLTKEPIDHNLVMRMTKLTNISVTLYLFIY